MLAERIAQRIYPVIEELPSLAEKGNRTALVLELPGDLETPVSVFLKLRGDGPAFLLESVEQGERSGRYSFVGAQVRAVAVVRGEEVMVLGERAELVRHGGNPLSVVQGWLAGARPVLTRPLPLFWSGVVGYIGYDVARQFEPRLQHTARPASAFDVPDAVFLRVDSMVAFDHVQHKLLIIASLPLDGDLAEAYRTAVERINEVVVRLKLPLAEESPQVHGTRSELRSNFSEEQFCAAVVAAKEHIAAGDIFQVVLSQRMEARTSAQPFQIYRCLRMINPSPYMFYLDLPDDLHLIGSSPEMLVRLQGRRAEVRPLAGTRRRGRSASEDAALARELLADPKERAEHVMLVDLGRNDLGRVCRYGSVETPMMLGIEQYSHVIHIVSHVVGELAEDKDAFDLLRATFPAGTVSGAPKIRAMEIIDELEPCRRGPYAGAVGYIGYDGQMDMCIAIRTIVMKDSIVRVQAGAGIVADSEPHLEYQETLNKARALASAISAAEQNPGGLT